MKQMIEDRNRTVVIVSHSIPTLENLCDTVMWMHDGEIARIGGAKEVLKEYGTDSTKEISYTLNYAHI